MPKRLPPTPGSLGDRLTQTLAHRGVTQRDLGRKLDCSGQAISMLVHGRMQSLPAIERAAVILGVDAEWLRTGLGVPPWAASGPLPAQTYGGLVDAVRRRYLKMVGRGTLVVLPDTIKAVDIESPSWRPQPMPLLHLAKELGIKVEFEKSIIDGFLSRMPVPVAMAAAQALQMALANCEDQDREKFRAALSWVEKATSE